ncbi:DinB family protein [Rubrivirga litoralis]|uniref:DinB family protein n=1 Tax=Rubrivirga litoralis TaxID=3075598 RepID=A0ABU3BSR4_9BACT|nr:DinB family protein [Rubrivirga sp. F394]MDT0632341.1 DinB family protein [Rubrivirga sp. F394]
MSGAAWAGRPADAELAPFYRRYVALVPDGDLLETLAAQGAETAAWLRSLRPALASWAYAPDKWTAAQVVAHVIDTERIFGARALRLGRGDPAPLPGYDQDAYVAALGPERRSLADLAGELERLRATTVDLLRSIPHPALDVVGTVSGGPMSARGAAYVIAGHERHHVQILRERYAAGGAA